MDYGVRKEVADQLALCWNKVREGTINPYGSDWDFRDSTADQVPRESMRFCMLCSIISFDEKIQKELPITAGMHDFLDTNYIKIEGTESLYKDFLPDSWDDPDIINDTIETSNRYVVFWWKKFNMIGAEAGDPTYVGFQPYNSIAEEHCDILVN